MESTYCQVLFAFQFLWSERDFITVAVTLTLFTLVQCRKLYRFVPVFYSIINVIIMLFFQFNIRYMVCRFKDTDRSTTSSRLHGVRWLSVSYLKPVTFTFTVYFCGVFEMITVFVSPKKATYRDYFRRWWRRCRRRRRRLDFLVRSITLSL